MIYAQPYVNTNTNRKIITSILMITFGSSDSFDVCLDELTTIVESLCEESIVMVVGDFNADIGEAG